jgi:hypothetical protein
MVVMDKPLRAMCILPTYLETLLRSRYILFPLVITACLFLGSQGVSREMQLTEQLPDA